MGLLMAGHMWFAHGGSHVVCSWRVTCGLLMAGHMWFAHGGSHVVL